MISLYYDWGNMETLGRAQYVELLERDYDACFDGTHALAFLHIENLKHFNRAHGVDAGDQVLHSTIAWAASLARDGLVARYAGNGLVFLVDANAVEDLAPQANALLPSLGEAHNLRSKIGTMVCRRPMSVDEVLRRILFACNSIEDIEDTFLCKFEGEVERSYDRRAYIVDHLDDAIAAGEIQAWAQPIVRVLTEQVCEVEILARWQNEHYGFLYPDEFIPALEQQGRIHKLDLEVIRLACTQWSEARAINANVPFGINLSRLDFELCDIYGAIRDLMARYDVPIDQVHIEVTESSAAHSSTITDGVRRFRKAGFQVYMDDFGSGFSSLGQMAGMRFDVIKFDKGMLDDVETNERARVVMADSISMVKRLGMQTLCEGVETAKQVEFLRAVGCEKAQGYFFGRPSPHDSTMIALAKRTNRQEDGLRSKYLDAVGQVNMLEGTSASLHGVEAAAFLGRSPVIVLELAEGHLRQLTCNLAFQSLIEHIGYESFDQAATTPTATVKRISARAIAAARAARDTGTVQTFDFIAGGVFCSVSVEFVAQMQGREAYLNTVRSVENAPQVTEHTLLEGVLETSNLCFFWKDTKRRFIGANQKFFDYYGFPGLESILGKTDEEMGWHENTEPFQNDELLVLNGETIREARGICMRGGELRDIIATKRPLYSHGAIVGLVGYFEDIGPHDKSLNPQAAR